MATLLILAASYVRSEVFVTSPSATTGNTVWAPGVGLNMYLRPNVIIKTNWTHPMFYMDNDPQGLASRQNFDTFNGMLVWAF